MYVNVQKHVNTLQHTAARCNTLQHTHCNILQYTCHISALSLHMYVNVDKHFNTLQHTVARCNTLQHTHCNTHTATHTLQHTHCNTHCNTHAATHCNTHTATHTLQHTHCNTHTATHYVCCSVKCFWSLHMNVSVEVICYGVATISRLLIIIGLFCKRAL